MYLKKYWLLGPALCHSSLSLCLLLWFESQLLLLLIQISAGPSVRAAGTHVGDLHEAPDSYFGVVQPGLLQLFEE